ncbi:hypothetical protein B0G69_6348 [Paraburkholderia sp. RAU2J]|nr:hypothetical protein B0G69_6348 [Paraburkholderia sp. RAU2J]
MLNRLSEFAGRIIRGKKDFDAFLCENGPWMNVSSQLASAAKHFDVGKDTGVEGLTTIELHVAPETAVHELRDKMKIWCERPQQHPRSWPRTIC